MSQEKTVLLLHWHFCARLHLVWYVSTVILDMHTMSDNAASPAYEHYLR